MAHKWFDDFINWLSKTDFCECTSPEKEERKTYPHLGTGIATGNLALGLISKNEIYCKKCGKLIKETDEGR